jgi:hypothetical protein
LGNLVKNSLGSLYTNFQPNKVNKGQFWSLILPSIIKSLRYFILKFRLGLIL